MAEVKLVITAEDNASGTIQKVSNTLKSEFEKANDTFKSIISTLTSLKSSLASLVAGFSFTQLIREGIQFNSTMENARLAIAGVITANADLIRNGQKITEPYQKFNAAIAYSNELLKKIQIISLQTTATVEEITEQFSTLLPYVIMTGASLDDALTFTQNLVNAVRALGLPMYQTTQEARALTQLQQLQSSQIAQSLGLSRQELETWKQKGILIQELNKRLEAYSIAAKEAANTWTGALSNLKDAISYLAGESFKPLTDYLTKQLNELKDSLIKVKDESKGVIEINQDLQNAFKSVGNAIIYAIEYFKLFASTIASVIKDIEDFYNANKEVLEPLLKIALLLAMIQTAVFAATVAWQGFVAVVRVVSTALTLLTGKIGLLVLSFIMLAGAIAHPDKALKALQQSFWAFAETVNRLFAWISDKFLKIALNVPDWLGGDKLKLFAAQLKSFFKDNVEISQQQTKQFHGSIRDFVNTIVDDVFGMMKGVLPKIKGFTGKSLEEINNQLATIQSKVKNDLEDKLKKVKTKASPKIKLEPEYEYDEKKAKQVMDKIVGFISEMNITDQFDKQMYQLAKSFQDVMDEIQQRQLDLEEPILMGSKAALEEWQRLQEYRVYVYEAYAKKVEDINNQRYQNELEQQTKIYMMETEIQKARLETLMKTHQISKLDYLQQELAMIDNLKQKYMELINTQKAGSTDYMETLKKITELEKQRVEINEEIKQQQMSGFEAFKYGVQQWVYEASDRFKNFSNMAVEIINKTTSLVSNTLFKLFTGQITKLRDLVLAFRDIIMQALTEVVAKILVVKALTAIGIAIPAMAEGGIVTKPTLALIGERGREAVVPLDKMDKFVQKEPERQSTAINIVNIVDPSIMSDYLVSSDGESAIMNVIARNKYVLRKMLG